MSEYSWKARFGVLAGDDGYFYARIIVIETDKPEWISDHGPYKTIDEAVDRLKELRRECAFITQESKPL